VFDLAQFPLGLTHADFGQVEWGSVPVPGEPGASGFSEVMIIPAPATMSLLAVLGMGMGMGLRRRSRKAP